MAYSPQADDAAPRGGSASTIARSPAAPADDTHVTPQHGRAALSRFQRYLISKFLWFFGAFCFALALNFYLPRLIPGNPVDGIIARLATGGMEGQALRQAYEAYAQQFGLDQPLWMQFLLYVEGLIHGDLGRSFGMYPAPVSTLIAYTVPWTLALQVPAILTGWIIGNVLGAIAAYRGGWFDRGAFLSSLVLSSTPYYCLAILLVYLLAVALPVFPAGGGYSYGYFPALTPGFVLDVLRHYLLPFLSIVIVVIGNQAIGMRSMCIYELGTDYVNYARGVGIPDNRVVAYIFRNAVLPQVTGLALSLGLVVSGALITEIVFSYPGVGTLLFTSIRQSDYPVIQAITLLITVGVLAANFLVDITYGLIDPRVRSAQTE